MGCGEFFVKVPLDNILCLDFEASAIGKGSFPIEVAVAEACTGALHSWLIRPTDQWLAVGVWSEESAAVHKIGRTELLLDGLPVARVAAELTARCKGRRVLSDAADFDGAWLATFYEAAQGEEAPFALHDFHTFAWQLALCAGRRPDIAYVRSELEAQIRFPMIHRAGADARCLAEMLRLIAGCP
jgi:hypothetical protein